MRVQSIHPGDFVRRQDLKFPSDMYVLSPLFDAGRKNGHLPPHAPIFWYHLNNMSPCSIRLSKIFVKSFPTLFPSRASKHPIPFPIDKGKKQYQSVITLQTPNPPARHRTVPEVVGVVVVVGVLPFFTCSLHSSQNHFAARQQ